MTQAPTLTTGRLTLRAHGMDDFAPYAAFFASDAARFIGGPQSAARAWLGFGADVAQWPLLGFGAWAVDETATGTLVGQVGLNKPPHFAEHEIGWLIFPANQRCGFAREAAIAVRDFAFRVLGWTTAVSYIDRGNAASIATARSLGATEDAAAPRHDHRDTVYRHPAPEARQ